MNLLRKLAIAYIGLMIVVFALNSNAGTFLLIAGIFIAVFAIPFVKGYRRTRKQPDPIPFS